MKKLALIFVLLVPLVLLSCQVSTNDFSSSGEEIVLSAEDVPWSSYDGNGIRFAYPDWYELNVAGDTVYVMDNGVTFKFYPVDETTAQDAKGSDDGYLRGFQTNGSDWFAMELILPPGVELSHKAEFLFEEIFGSLTVL